ncbi:P-loop containing nucleoside triphosphate hydrolase protein [Whalleya microplaca]|nr:P-loop containing nucleoside triphosphate hydrolase protein [Whalleya microplaca]
MASLGAFQNDMNRSLLQDWHASLNPLTVDIVGDFAGKELFAIHGEALLVHSLRTARVDYEYGFQLLHAVHAVESFLSRLRDRGCNFHIIWFDSHKDLCIPYGTPSQQAYKYLLTRAVLIRHFATRSFSTFSHRFDSIHCHGFRKYLACNPQYFFMCSDGRSTHSEDHPVTLAHLSVAYQIAQFGYCVAFIDEINFTNSKVHVSIATPPGKMAPLEHDDSPMRNDSSYGSEELERLPRTNHLKRDLTTREIITLQALSRVFSSGTTEAKSKGAFCIVLHLILLRHYDLSLRSFPQINTMGPTSCYNEVMRDFCQSATNILDQGGNEASTAKWDAFDLFDGRLYLQICSRFPHLHLPESLKEELSSFLGLVNDLTGISMLDMIPNNPPDNIAEYKKKPDSQADRISSAVLPFSHPILDQYLQQVQLETEDALESPHSQVFQELTHWHNAKKPLDPKHVSKPLGFFARKRNQKFMADTLAYSASLSGASGKNIKPEIIVVRPSTDGKRAGKGGKPAQRSNKDWKEALKERPPAKNKKLTSKNGPQSGKEKAFQAAERTKAAKLEGKSLAVNSFWGNQRLELEKEDSLIKRFLKAEKYFAGLSSSDQSVVGAEISLYICGILTLLIRSDKSPKQSIPEIKAMLWWKVIEMNGMALTQEIAYQLGSLIDGLKIPLSLSPTTSVSKKLPFKIEGVELKSASRSDPLEFQLDYSGPYMERSFDSAPDPRVPFNPDAWQRKVLDAIDADKSLFVVAPTSAGKTFISFYAMKKALQASDDDVVVYVAPTKALVNQIAAEVQARFSKSYHNLEGRSVWAIHTRDYRVNNPTGCQVLVTVPHILQIMLLASSNAKTSTSWSRRVKRIIFDEVHCIGQSEDGVIWEQLLLLAPCPIIALSATVGNPLEFKEWLEGTQKVKGFDLEMIVHGYRYSDLRKYIYNIPISSDFKGLLPVTRLPFPGLESDADASKRFTFVHPIGALIGKNIDTLNDTSLEPRDCLHLWKCLKKHENDHYKADDSLSPKRSLPSLVKKSDVAKWETSLKQQLEAWMINRASPFESIQEDLRGKQFNKLVQVDAKLQAIVPPNRRSPLVYGRPIFSLALDLRNCGALPAIFFNYDRLGCEAILVTLLKALKLAEVEYKETDPKWKKKIAEFETWKKTRGKTTKLTRTHLVADEEGLSKLDFLREDANQEKSPWDSFDPYAPLSQFSFADSTKISDTELQERLDTLKNLPIRPQVIEALRRGLGVHHAGMNRQYRQVVEMLFRKGYLTVVVATGTLALGLNMPCKTVVFAGDSVFLTALNYRQASGRAGRRGFDVLGNVVFHGVPPKRSLEIMSARLPDLRGQFPISVTLILRLFSLLHGTDNSEYATKAVKSLLTQTRLYLGGPAAQMSIQHHLRFSIDYLRRQHLLAADGTPLNFSGLIGHLYFTENAVFAFHSLLKEGYFHKLCSGLHRRHRQKEIILEIVLIFSHLFCRIPCHRYQDKSWFEGVVHRSPSLILLPELPEEAARILTQHNRETLKIFKDYVSTYTAQHLSDVADTQLPFTEYKIEPHEPHDMEGILPSLDKTTVRSSFAALSGFTDEFKTIEELCDTVRSGVFLEQSAIPYIPMAPHETGGVPWNAYIYDFFKHGDMDALVRDNGIKGGDVWYRLKDFSLILATIKTSLANFLKPKAEVDDAAMIDVQDAGDEIEEGAGFDADEEQKDVEAATDGLAALHINRAGTSGKEKAKKKKVVDSWDAEESSDSDGLDGQGTSGTKAANGKGKAHQLPSGGDENTSEPPSCAQDGGASLTTVYMAFAMLHEEFDEKFKKVWA